MEFLVEFTVTVPEGTPDNELSERERGEARATARLIRDGNLVRLWNKPAGPARTTPIGLFRADDETQLRALLDALPLGDWLRFNITQLRPHPNDPSNLRARVFRLPEPSTSPVYRLEATAGEPLELGDTPLGHRRVVPLTGGTFDGPELKGVLVPGASADSQTILADGTTIGDIRYTLRTDGGDLMNVTSRGVRHGSASALARLARGEEVSPDEYTFRTATQIETAAADLDWLNKGIFVAVGARRPDSVIYETYLVR